EVGIDHQAGLAAHQVLRATSAQRLAMIGGAAVLPDDGPMHGPASAAIPQHGGLALIGDADGRDVAGAGARGATGPAEHGERDAPDLLRVVLDPPGLRKVLRELAIGTARDPAATVEHEDGRSRGSLIDGDDEAHRRARSDEEPAP